MKKVSKSKRVKSAEAIAKLADNGADVSAYFTNTGKMMPPLGQGQRINSREDKAAYSKALARALDNYQRSTRELMDRVHRRDLIYEFFFVFSRFEHALAMAHYLNENKGGVSADWNKFARETNDVFLATLSPEVKEAIRYYERKPPRKQVVDFDSLTWKDVVPKTNYELEKLLLLIRRVRNNLFHGEKIGVLLEGDSERDSQLLKHGLTILYACLQSSPDLRSKFFSELDTEVEEEDEELLQV
jgi:hypothetical protein